MFNTTKRHLPQLLCIACLGLAGAAQAADWSDTSISYRTGNDYREPFNPQDISKHIFALTHVSGYKYGSNFFNADFLISDKNDPASLNQGGGAQEAYILYRNTFDLGKISGKAIKFGPVSGVGITAGFDVNTKNDVGYNSRKRMLVLGPTLMWDVPGHLNTSLLLLNESNAPSGAFAPISGVTGRYTYKTHAMLAADWSIPVSSLVAFEGYANFIAAKGKDEVGRDTGAETNIDMQLMLDVGALAGSAKNTFRVGVEYQYWRNKFGNTSATTGGRGNVAKTPMLRAEYHF
ncbi:outer envelope protein [Rugamonas rubra]|uniref:Nucleoside-specific outer membrane channel protein Tsx n=1 Tax=Rugamonas rubra TaxID=758825 RepID=A0A1I4PH40_9BURK|nr:outer envelope protein [Rugamonas rubra]SFM27101.1 Nucleoside-specific outer membrane channel protein Tsx [Rugamonas rubra]